MVAKFIYTHKNLTPPEVTWDQLVCLVSQKDHIPQEEKTHGHKWYLHYLYPLRLRICLLEYGSSCVRYDRENLDKNRENITINVA